MTTGMYLDTWLQTYVAPKRAPNTVACYLRAIKSLPSELLNTELHELCPINIQQELNKQAARYPRAAQLTYTMLHVAMVRAHKLRLIDSNPLDVCDKPLHEPRETAILTVEQLRMYLDAAQTSIAYPLLLCIAVCGLRRSEALAIRRETIKYGELYIDKQRIRDKGKYSLKTLKSKSSRRVIPLPDVVNGALMLGSMYSSSEYIVDITPERLTQEHNETIQRAGVPRITLHGLRHSMATIAAEQGIPITVIQHTLGHSHYQLTADIYAGHRRAESIGRAVSQISGCVFGFQGA